MQKSPTFRPYTSQDMFACLRLFDANCPEFFAPNERGDYKGFLESGPLSYELCLVQGRVVGAFGLVGESLEMRSLNWILLSPDSQGMGVGSAIMSRVVHLACTSSVSVVSIAASHKSAPFFARFGAVEVAVVGNGWGPGMHRVDMELRF